MYQVPGRFAPTCCEWLATIPTGRLCQACQLQVREDQDHLAGFSGYEDLREGQDFGDDKELVEFYQAVMKRREQQGWD